MLREKLKEYIEVSGAIDNMTTAINTANAYMLEQSKGTYTSAEREEIKKLNDKYMLLIKGRLDEFRDKFVDLYAEFYNEEDVDALLAYHKSPVAKKIRDTSDKVLARALEISTDFHKDLLKQLDGATLNRQVN